MRRVQAQPGRILNSRPHLDRDATNRAGDRAPAVPLGFSVPPTTSDPRDSIQSCPSGVKFRRMDLAAACHTLQVNRAGSDTRQQLQLTIWALGGIQRISAFKEIRPSKFWIEFTWGGLCNLNANVIVMSPLLALYTVNYYTHREPSGSWNIYQSPECILTTGKLWICLQSTPTYNQTAAQ